MTAPAKKLKKLPPLVEIHWGDAWSNAGWRDEKDIDHTPVRCVTVGYLIKTTRAGYTTVGTIAPDDEMTHSVLNVSFRPKGMVTKIKVLRK